MKKKIDLLDTLLSDMCHVSTILISVKIIFTGIVLMICMIIGGNECSNKCIYVIICFIPIFFSSRVLIKILNKLSFGGWNYQICSKYYHTIWNQIKMHFCIEHTGYGIRHTAHDTLFVLYVLCILWTMINWTSYPNSSSLD